MEEAPKRRRWFAYSLRTLLLLVTVFCVWFGWWVNGARRQKDAVAVVLKANGRIIYDYQVVPGKPGDCHLSSNSKLQDPVPLWMRNLFGDDCFHRVVSISFTGGSLEKTDFAVLQQILPQLHTFFTCQLRVDDQRLTDIAWLKNCSGMEVLNLRGARFNNDDMKVLRNLTRLKYLGLYGVPIGDEGLENLASLTDLDTLVLDGTQVTDIGLLHLYHLSNLNELGLQRTRVTALGAAKLRKALPKCSISVSH